MGIFKNFDRNRWLYNGLIGTFILLYAATAFVSFYHAITFFNIANAVWLSVLLSFVAEIGQASVLFGILLTDNRKKYLPWMIMFILTSLQVIGNVVSSFDWIVAHNDAGLDGFKRSILFAVQTEDPEMFRIIVAWISGALLPIIALSMTALVAQNINLRAEEKKKSLENLFESSGTTTPQETIDAKDIISEVSRLRPTEEELTKLQNLLNVKKPIIEIPKEEEPIVERGVPFDEPIYDVDIESKSTPPIDPMDEYKKTITSLPTTKEDVLPALSDDEVHEMNLDEYEKKDTTEPDMPDEDGEFGPVDLSDEIPDQILPGNVEAIQESAENLIPEVIISQTNGLIDVAQVEEIFPPIEEIPPLIELEKKPEETPEIKKPEIPPPPPQPPIDYLTPDQLERIRQIARDRLLKKK